jgi:hypothetical protein
MIYNNNYCNITLAICIPHSLYREQFIVEYTIEYISQNLIIIVKVKLNYQIVYDCVTFQSYKLEILTIYTLARRTFLLVSFLFIQRFSRVSIYLFQFIKKYSLILRYSHKTL